MTLEYGKTTSKGSSYNNKNYIPTLQHQCKFPQASPLKYACTPDTHDARAELREKLMPGVFFLMGPYLTEDAGRCRPIDSRSSYHYGFSMDPFWPSVQALAN